MLIILKQSIKKILILLLCITIGYNLYAVNLLLHKNDLGNALNFVKISLINDYMLSDPGNYFSKDTVITRQNDTLKKESKQNEIFSIPSQLLKIPINFRINSFISYHSFNHFVQNESREMFYNAWLKEKELQKLSIQTDSLRKEYSIASSEQKLVISSQILKDEEKSIALNEEIPAMYEKARDLEDNYWQTASLDQISKFQKKIKLYKDSIAQIEGMQVKQQASPGKEYTDTLTLFIPSPKTAEKKAVVSGGISYKIQIGAYKGKIPESANKLIKKISMIRKVENYIDDKGLKIYTTGNLRLYPEALTMLSQVKQEGIKTAVINAYQNGKKITVMEARKLNHEL